MQDDEEGYLYDAKLNLCDISYGTYGHNKYISPKPHHRQLLTPLVRYYIIQALGNRVRSDRFYLWYACHVVYLS